MMVITMAGANGRLGTTIAAMVGRMSTTMGGTAGLLKQISSWHPPLLSMMRSTVQVLLSDGPQRTWGSSLMRKFSRWRPRRMRSHLKLWQQLRLRLLELLGQCLLALRLVDVAMWRMFQAHRRGHTKTRSQSAAAVFGLTTNLVLKSSSRKSTSAWLWRWTPW